MAEIFTEIMKEKKDVLQSKLFEMIKVQVFKEFHKNKTKYPIPLMLTLLNLEDFIQFLRPS